MELHILYLGNCMQSILLQGVDVFLEENPSSSFLIGTHLP